ncbi:MAG: signal peptide peptidase SppA [Gammaproteobacteria bacterium]|nr:signal peptide peptidase SppA [Gammaproteobacteria bacterium]MDH5302936.1 signal peptide peptidase SppA [Gammaproteobacteria bacterium]MDH5321150.1 signal peptide peptidase SppA [Gammaproteobacteria bacterium]
MSTKNPLLRLLSAFWSGLDAIRKILHLLLLLFVFLVFFGLAADDAVVMSRGAALSIEPYGMLVEQLEGDPYDRAIASLLGDGKPQTLVQDIVDAFAYAKDDERIEIVYLDLSRILGAGLSKLQQVAAAMDDFRASGKSIVASADFLSQHGYFLAAHADEIYLHPDGAVMFLGYGRFGTYYKDAIDLLRIDWNVFRVGTHKSFVEPFTRTNMSDEDRAASQRLVDGMWQMYRNDVEEARGLDTGSIDHFADNLLDYVGRAGGDIAIAALDFGLVDELLTRTEVRQRMIDAVGEDKDRPGQFYATDMYDYLQHMRFLDAGAAQQQNVAIIVAAGDILFGEQSPGTIGADSTAALLRQARADDSVSAVVLRVDSPGGSSFAAEVIVDEVLALREAGKPVVASLSSIAASGGYAISMYADRVIASPATLTGSIGVFGMFPTYQRSIGTIGITTDGVGTTPWSGQFRPDREMSEQTRQLFQLFIEDTYDDFISDVAAGRGLDKSEVDAIGQGQVWTGVEAVENGLVDELGGLDDAIDAAAGLAGLEDGQFGTVVIEPQLSPSEQMIVDLLGVAASVGLDMSRWVRAPDFIHRVAQRIDETAGGLLRFNDPNGVYRHCLCDLR